MIRITGIYREPECSPGRHRSNDTLLLEQVALALHDHGITADLITIGEAAERHFAVPLVLSMCQAPPSLDRLARLERLGGRLINSATAARNTYRDRLASMLTAAGIRNPATTIVETRVGGRIALAAGGVWLKRGDVHASVSADVQWIDRPAALRRALDGFRARGITRATLQAHVAGVEVKFYGLADGTFFRWFTADRTLASSVDVGRLQSIAYDAASVAGLDIFGGDVIVEPSGELTLIDLNDWPSFAPYRDDAAIAIAAYVARRIDVDWNPALVSSANQGAV